MNTFAKTTNRITNMVGVTLLEIMLVLAIAAMVIVMSIRYYQTTISRQQANVVLQKITAIIAAADSVAMASGSYSGITGAVISGLVGGYTTPWSTAAGAITVENDGGTKFKITILSVPPSVCGILYGQLSGDPRVTGLTACTTSTVATWAFSYKLPNT